MSRNWIKPALAVSLAVNLLVVGAVGSAWLSHAPERTGPTGGPPELRSFSRAMDSDQRARLRARLRADGGLRGGRARLREARGGLVTALRADPFDADGLRTALAAQREIQADLVSRALEALVATAEDMTPEERSALADALTRRRR